MATAEPATGGSTEYINHHLHHLQVSVGDGGFMTLNIDTLFFTLALSLLFLFFFIRSARKATAGVPGKFQALVEIIVGFVDGLGRETFHCRS
jgi:F-type H+-transporting ATPase subunit a